MKVAAAQLSPIHLNVEATLEKMEVYIKKASEQGVQLIVFPETFITKYPDWVPDPFDPANSNFGEYFNKYFKAAVEIPGPVTDFLGKVALNNKINIVTGVVERDPIHKGTIYDSVIVIGSDGKLLGCHRKLTPVNHERQYYAAGTRSEDVKVYPTNVGNVGIGICFENRNSLYQYALGKMGENIHCALWGSPGPRKGEPPAYLSAYDYVHNLAAAYALTNGVYVIASALVTMGEQEVNTRWYHTGGPTFIMAPTMEILAKVDEYTEGLAIADINPDVLDTCRGEYNPYGKESTEDLIRKALGF